jgi:hypothetical protein
VGLGGVSPTRKWIISVTSLIMVCASSVKLDAYYIEQE